MKINPRVFLQKAMAIKHLEENVDYILKNTEPLCWICKRKSCKDCPLERNRLFNEYRKKGK